MYNKIYRYNERTYLPTYYLFTFQAAMHLREFLHRRPIPATLAGPVAIPLTRRTKQYHQVGMAHLHRRGK